ncbi:hypothetical protein M0R72_05710 [Candidatus Pacearchaeota archaeon]|nr:hypothetical protein [Candidatus Pacearchaeota archaeon]
MSTIPTTESGKDWLECLTYEGPGAKDPSGGIVPEGFQVEDLVSHVVVFRGGKAVTVPAIQVKQGDKVIKAVMNEDLIGALYEGDADAIRLKDATGRELTRLGWYKDSKVGGRDGLRVWATGRIRRRAAGPGVKVLK